MPAPSALWVARLRTQVARSGTWSLAQSAALGVAASMVVMPASVCLLNVPLPFSSFGGYSLYVDVLGARQGEVTFRGAVKYPGDGRDPPVYLSWPLARLSVDS